MASHVLETLPIILGPSDPYGLTGLVQTTYAVHTAYWQLPDAPFLLSLGSQDLSAALRPLEATSWAEVPLALQIQNPQGRTVLLRLTLKRRKLPHPFFFVSCALVSLSLSVTGERDLKLSKNKDGAVQPTSHMSGKTFSVWHPKINVLRALIRAQDTRSALLIQVLDSGGTDELEWLGKEKHNYGHLFRVTIPRNSALLVVKATLSDLAAYSADYVRKL